MTCNYHATALRCFIPERLAAFLRSLRIPGRVYWYSCERLSVTFQLGADVSYDMGMFQFLGLTVTKLLAAFVLHHCGTPACHCLSISSLAVGASLSASD